MIAPFAHKIKCLVHASSSDIIYIALKVHTGNYSKTEQKKNPTKTQKPQLNYIEAIYPHPWVKSPLQRTVMLTSLWPPYHGPPSRCKRRSKELVSYLQILYVPRYFLPGLGEREEGGVWDLVLTLEQSL